MTVAFDIRPVARTSLGRDDVRRSLVALLRRRVPVQEVDDLAQTILCDALAAGSMPTDEEELRRWLVGIARHKIADYHRRASRTAARSEGDAPLATCATSPAAFEEREVLHQLLGEVRSRRDAETMEWLVREHGGERLTDIAEENALPAPVVRQRVSRLRRALRSRWGVAAGLLLLLAGAAAYALTREKVAIAPDAPIVLEAPATANPVAPAPAPAILEDVQGDWVVQTLRPDHEVSAADQKLVDRYLKTAKVHVEGERVTLRAGRFAEVWTAIGSEGGELRLASEAGASERVNVNVRDARAARAGAEVEVRIEGHPRLSGVIVLRRPIY